MSHDLNVEQIKKLWVLHLIIQTRSLKQAAILAHVTPSAVSQTLSALEKSVGKPLIIRNKTAIEPTAHALNILDVVAPAFEAFEKLKSLNNYKVPDISWINLGTYESIAIDLLPGLIQSFREKLPKTKLKIKIARTQQLLTQIRKGDLCSALITEVDDLDKFYQIEVGSDRLGFYAAKNHPISDFGWKAAIEKFGLGNISFTGDGLPLYYKKFLNQFDRIQPVVISESFETLRTAASQGLIVAILPERVATRNKDLIELEPPQKIKHHGQHKLILVSQLSCDKEENDFLAFEAQKILHR